MLQKLSDKTSGWIAMVILGLLTIPFALFGLDQYLVQRTDSNVATIEAPPHWWLSAPGWWPVSIFWQHNDIGAAEFRDRFEQVRQRQRAAQGEAFDAKAFGSAETKRAVLEAMIDEEIQRIASAQAGVQVSDALVRSTIQEIPAFQVDGKFNLERYQLSLASQVPAQTPLQFDQSVREGLQQTLVSTRIIDSSFVTDAEMERLIRLLGERRDVSLVMLPPPSTDAAAVSAAEIQQWYETHKADYQAPESVSIEYIELDAESLPTPPPADDAALRARFDEEKGRFLEQEQRLASHILVRVEPGADAAAQQAAKQKALQLADQARMAGADFSALARASSDDSGSKASGGDLGWIGKDMMPGPFEDALFALQPGEVSAPVKTDFGWHVIALREVKSGQQESFEQVRESLVREQAEADRERAFNAVSSKVVDAVLENPSSLASAAQVAELPVQQAGPFTRNATEGIAADPAIQRAAFSDTLIQDGTVSDPIELGPNHSAWIRVAAHTPERVRPLSQVRDQVAAAVRADRARADAIKRADALLARIWGGESLQALAAAEGLPEPQQIADVQRGMPLPEASVSEAIFATPVPAAGKPTAGKALLPDGRVVLFAVKAVRPGSADEIDAQQRTMLQQQVAQMSGGEDVRSLVAAWRERMKIKVIEGNL